MIADSKYNRLKKRWEVRTPCKRLLWSVSRRNLHSFNLPTHYIRCWKCRLLDTLDFAPVNAPARPADGMAAQMRIVFTPTDQGKPLVWGFFTDACTFRKGLVTK